MTEDDAKTKGCCGAPAFAFAILAATAWSNGGEVTLAPGRTDGGFCIGSACMGWRWTGTIGDQRQGHCGLAGEEG